MLPVSWVLTALHGVNVTYLHKNVFVMKFYVGSVLCIMYSEMSFVWL
jgi:hypothetical protein